MAAEDLEPRKRAAIDRLTVRFSRDEVPMEEYERLVADIHRAADGRELAVIEDIVGVGSASGPGFGAAAPDLPGFIPAEQVQTCVAFLSERRFAGSWLNKPVVSAMCCFASQVFDFRHVRLPPGRTTLELMACFGSVEIIVPPSLAVRMEVAPIAAEASVGRGVAVESSAAGPVGAESADAPLLVVTGNVLFGSVTVQAK